MAIPGISGGFSGLGQAVGSIVIDTSSAERAATTMRRVGRDIETSMGRARSSLREINAGIQQFRTELLAIGAAGAALTIFGVSASRDIRNARIRLRQFVGTEEEANDLMRRLTDNASEFGLELNGVLSLSGTLIPVLEDGTEELDNWILRAARLKTVNPFARTGDDVRAITELISGQTVSLQRLFNIPPELINQAKAQFEDAGQQLDFILDRMGATEEAARAMADPLVSVKNELKLIAAISFEPLLQWLRETLPGIREFLQNLRDTNPEILRIGGAFATMAAVGAPALLFLGQVLSTLEKIRALGIAGALGRAGLFAGAVGVTAVGVTAGTQALAQRGIGNEELADAGFFEIMREGLKTAVDIILGAISLIGQAYNAAIDAVIKFANAVVNAYTSIGRVISQMGNLLPERLGGAQLVDVGNAMQEAGEGARDFYERLQEANDAALPDFFQTIADIRERIRGALDVGGGGTAATGAPGGAMTGGGTSGLTEEQQAQIAAWEQYQDEIAGIEQRAREQRLQLTEQYESQRTDIIRRYEQTIAREAEDFNRRRARDIQNLNDTIADIQAEATENEIEWRQELNETIAEIRQAGNGRIAEIEADAQRTREQMERQHRDNLLSAASRLDARAVAEENRRFRTQSANFEQNLQARIEKERDNLQERIEQEQEGHRQRVEQQRQSNEERIEAMREAQEERFAIEDEERAIRLARMEEDHQAQLAELRKANREQLRENKEQYRRELDELRTAFIKQNLEQTSFYDEWLATQRSEQQASLIAWNDFWRQWQQAQGVGGVPGGTGGGTGGTDGGTGGTPTEETGTPIPRDQIIRIGTQEMIDAGWTQTEIFAQLRVFRDWTDAQIARWIESNFDVDIPGYARGALRVPQTGLATVHQDEAILSKGFANIFRSLIGFASAMPATPAAVGGSSRQFTMGDINVSQQPGQSGMDVAKAVRREIVDVFRSLQ